MNDRDTVGQPAGQVLLRLGPLERVRVSVAMAEYLSTLAGVVDAVGGLHRGLPGQWRTRLQQSISYAGHEAFSPAGSPPSSGWIPDCLLPLPAVGDAALNETVDVVRSARASDVADNLRVEFGTDIPPAWLPALDHPGRWIETCGEALHDAATQMTPLWQQARPLRDREVERVGVASVRGAIAILLNSLNSKIRYVDGTMVFAHAVPGTYELGGRELVLAPIVTGDRMIATYFDDPYRVWICYPAPGLGSLWGSSPPAPPVNSQLAALIGPAGAVILQSLQRPAHMRDLITATRRHPNVVTRECDRLKTAGLISRHRVGRDIRITRTPLAEALLELYRSRS